MRILRIYILLAILSCLFTESCKKGENDPFLTLRSRKARLTGEWNLKSGNESYSFDNIDIKIEYTEDSKSINSNEYEYSEQLVFKKNGEYKWIFKDNNATITEKGSWEFGRRNKSEDYKSKETVILNISEITTEGSESSETEYFGGDYILSDGNNNIKQIRLDELRNNKLVIVAEGSHEFENQSITFKMEKVFEQ